MKLARLLPVALASASLAAAPIVTNLSTAHWIQEKGGASSAVLREDPATGGTELLVRYPSGHVIPPLWHQANERIIVLEGQLTLRQESGDAHLAPGAFAFLPAREVQRLSCTSQSRCTLHLFWDGNFQSHAAP